ncbi:MAG: S8 family serine peptidase [Thermohalobaculum sp.]|nr:S8 family serine peptidase [Thermohalobaculum sp.]
MRLSVPHGLDEDGALSAARTAVPGQAFDLNHLYGPTGAGCEGDACWGAQAIGMQILPESACGRGAPIAIIDTPVDAGHPALRDARVTVQNFLSDGARPSGEAHGTAIAALLVGRATPGAKPLAPGARLLAAGAFRSIEGRSLADAVAVLRSIDWALGEGARVIAMSFEGAPNATLAAAVKAVERTGASLVAAAGNGGPDAGPAYPAAYPEVLAVTAVDRRLRPYNRGTRGAYVEIAAPGVGIVSADGGGGSRRWSGSSFAVPFVAAALLRARAETRGDAYAARRLLAGAARDLGAPGRDFIYGHGLLQVPGDRCS